MGECWIPALKPKSRGGYCSIKIGSCSGGRRPKTFRPHRYVYEQVKGPIPAGLIVRHTCDNPACSNPAHLDVGTHFDDTTDKFNRGKGPQKVNLIELRNLKAQGLSQLKIAKVLGLSPSTVGQYFAPRGRYRDRLERGLEKITNFLRGVSGSEPSREFWPHPLPRKPLYRGAPGLRSFNTGSQIILPF